ncbi:histone-lysine N-methyltransferase ATXR3-like isoform X2 [Asparagus officinalis]|uniref:histone-lysine N-methyltransferase ATXR3-like isoform X2 n=1 Tax=Asparagus officinalis TaxID=4686 RepID=UPI00098DF78D|nr:histone-lysine N-methyltransferase ATXR3-like isoform X2 [Asparagus officinalis]
MGDGGVTLAPSQHVMDSVFSSKKPVMMRKGEGNCDKGRSSDEKARGRELERRKKGDLEKGELQNGELELGEFIPEKGDSLPDNKWKKNKKWELEKGEFVLERKGEVSSERWGKWEVEKKGDRGRKLELENKGLHGWGKWDAEKKGDEADKWSGRGRRMELEKGEFVPENSYRNKGEGERLDFGLGRNRKIELEKGEFVPENSSFRRKEGSWGEADNRKRSFSSNCESKKSSRAPEEEPGEFKYESSNGKGRDKEYYSESWPKRHCMEPESSGRKYPSQITKNRRKPEVDNPTRASYSERAHGNPPPFSSSRVSLSVRHPSASRPSHDKQRHRDHRDHTPTHSERSPIERGRYHDRRDRSPAQPERSPMERTPMERTRHYDMRDRSPAHPERSPMERVRPHDYRDQRDRTPSHSDRAPLDKARHHDHRDRTPNHLDRSPLERTRYYDYRERSPHDRGRAVDHRDKSRKSGGSEKQQISRYEERHGRRDSGGRDTFKNGSLRQVTNSSSPITSFERSGSDDKSSRKKNSFESAKEPSELPPPPPSPPPPPPPELPPPPLPPQPESNGVLDELPSMEEDMDICDTPPHDTIPVDTKPGKWFYLDYWGAEQGPSKLDDLKRLMEEGLLQTDHLIKHCDSDRWVTVENATSPLVQLDFPSIVSDAVTKMVSPPEAPGNALSDTGDVSMDSPSPLVQEELGHDDEPVAVEFNEEFHINERVDILLDGYNLVDGKELEIIGEVLNATFEPADWENWDYSEDFTRSRPRNLESTGNLRDEGLSRAHEGFPREINEIRPVASLEEYAILNSTSSDWFSGRWSCKGGDWKRNDESGHDRSSKKKIVLNHGYPLCQMPKCGDDDPRWHRRDDLYYPSRTRKLELPPWAFSLSEDNSDTSNDIDRNTASRQLKPPIPRGVKGTSLPVVRINACVVRDHGSVESHSKLKGDRHSQRSVRSHSYRSSSVEGSSSHSKKSSELDFQSLHKCRTVLSIPKDHVCTVDELALDLGDWYYLDGAGHEHGPSSYSELQHLAARGTIMQNSSVFRKVDNTWIPVAVSEAANSREEVVHRDGDSTAASDQMARSSCSFHDLHPQFIGYMRGKLHELVMKSYKNREFAASINEVLDPWITEKQAKLEMDKHFAFNSSITKSSGILAHGLKSDDNYRAGKRARLLFDESDGDSEMEGKGDPSFDDLCGEVTFVDGNSASPDVGNKNWGLLNGHILARVFHFIRSDMKSLVSSAATCKRWNLAAKFYRNLCTQVDLSSVGPICTDSMFRNIMDGYDRKRLISLTLTGCSNVSASVLEEILHLFPCICSLDIRGCSQFKELLPKFQNVKWRKSSLYDYMNSEESYPKIKSLKQITNDESTLGDRKDSSSHPFRQGVYKRAKPFDARKSSEVMSRDAQMKRWLHRKSENGYRKMEKFIAVAQIEDRMRNGYYIRHGLGSVKDDISRMCRDAIKAKNRGNAKEMKHIIMLFIRLAKNLEGSPELPNERDEMVKSSSESGFYSSTPRYKKKQNKVLEKKGMNRTNSTSYFNGGTDSLDREIKKSLSKLKKRQVCSDSETSDDHENDFWEEDDRGEGETTASDTESDLDIRSGSGAGDIKGNMYSMVDDSSDSISDDREWGARMTKASLVPPVTRKYEVIDSYLVIADEDEVKRKMRVALPDDYSEKLLAQKSGLEESDMEIPEVKEYKPRKLLGVEVLEQEVYGIDPYTHNLLLDSMPEEPEWLLGDKHKFIEEVLLRALNKQVRHFTGSGNTPMVYRLRPVVEEVLKNAEDEGDRRIMRLCQSILKAMQSRPDDNYVAYRKGLGVVCNKEGGFGTDDFVVEFLGEVYPAWKWFEKQDGIRSLQKNNQDPAPEFYNIYLERPKGDRDGYDLVVVDAMHKANYASRICHSCRPNCEAKVTAVDGQYQIGIYTVRPIGYGEEVTFDYNSVTESKEEYEASVCLCGSQICRGSYLNLTGEDAFHKVLKECHGILDRHKLMLEACEANFVSEEDYIDLGKAGLGTCLLSGLPDWLVAYSARLVRFINLERTKLPEAILKHNMEEKRKYLAEICIEDERSESEVQAEGVYNSRLQNMALTLDKVRYVMRRVFGDPKQAPPPLEKLSSEDLVFVLWKGKGSLVEELLQSMAPHMEVNLLNDLKSKIRAHDPSDSDTGHSELRKSLLWLRDELRNLPCTSKCRHDAAADLIHIYAYTKCFYKIREYKTVTSPPVYISPLDLGPKYADKMGPGFQEYCKTYGENYCLGQLIYWHSQTNADPDCRLTRARKGCLSLPDVSSFYGKSQKPVHERVYDSRTLRFMMARMEKQPQRPWPKDRIWVFKNDRRFIGSPMLDAVIDKCPLDKEMLHWLKTRHNVYNGLWDE